MITQRQIDNAYREGKEAYFRDVGTHGPTLKPRQIEKTPNPYRHVALMVAWERGYHQDVRRVIEPRQ